jgi:hypothetical protein
MREFHSELVLHDEVRSRERSFGEQAAQERIGDAERDVADRSERIPRVLDARCVRVEDANVRNGTETVPEPSGEDRIQLDGEELFAASGDLISQGAAPRSDLDDELVGADVGATNDLSRGAPTEEMLSGGSRTAMPWPLLGHGRSP